MKKFEFKQNDLKRGIPFAIIYLLSVFIFCYIKFDGILGMADAVNNFGSAKGVGLLIGLGVIGPFIILLAVIMPKVSVEISDDKLLFHKGKKDNKIMYLEDIAKIQINVDKLNQMEIFGRDGAVFIAIQPQHKPEILKEIISEISKHVAFSKQTSNRNYFGQNIETSVYTRKV